MLSNTIPPYISQSLSTSSSFRSAFLINCVDSDESDIFIRDIDLGTCFINDPVDSLSSRSDDQSDLVRVYSHADKSRSILTELSTRCRDSREKYFVDDLLSTLLCQFESLTDDVKRETIHFDIYLNRCDTVFSTGNLKVHITEEVLDALDIHEYEEVILILFIYDKTCRNTSYRLFDRNTCIHKSQCACTDRTLGCRTVRHQDLGYGTDRIREFFLRRKYRNKGSLSKSTMTDLTASRRTGSFCLTNRIARHVVVMHITLGYFIIQTIDRLRVRKRSKSTCSHDLSLSTLEETGTVNTRKKSGTYSQRTNHLGITAVNAGLAVQAAISLTDAEARAREVRTLTKLAAKDPDIQRFVIVTLEEEETIDCDGISIEVLPAAKFLLEMEQKERLI